MVTEIKDHSEEIVRFLTDIGVIDKKLCLQKLTLIVDLDKLPTIEVKYIAQKEYEGQSDV